MADRGPNEQKLHDLDAAAQWNLTGANEFRFSLQTVSSLFKSLAEDSGLKGETGDAAANAFSTMADSMMKVHDWVGDIQDNVQLANDAKNTAQSKIDALPSAEVDGGTATAITAGSTMLGGLAGLAASHYGLAWYEGELAKKREEEAGTAKDDLAETLRQRAAALETIADTAPAVPVMTQNPEPPQEPGYPRVPSGPTGGNQGGSNTSGVWQAPTGTLIEGPTITDWPPRQPPKTGPIDVIVDPPTPVDPEPPVIIDGNVTGTTQVPGTFPGTTGGTNGGNGGLTGGIIGAGGAAALAAGGRLSSGGLGGLGLGGIGGGGGSVAGAGARGAGVGAAGRGAGRGLLGGMSAEDAAARSTAGAAGRGGAGGPGGMMGGGGAGGAGAGGSSDKRKRRGLGGPLAPRLEEDEELGPLSNGAAAGGRDDD
jgi:hypothetical protein